MDGLYNVMKFIHVLAFVFMSIPLFNLIVVNERALLGSPFNYQADRYMENIIKRGAGRCYTFQLSVLTSGIFLLLFGPLGITALWTSWIVLAKTLILFTLMGLLSTVHFKLQPKIESFMDEIGPDTTIPDGFAAKLKPYRVKRKQLATFCLFLVITCIILGLQVYSTFHPALTLGLIGLAAVFSWRANKTNIRFGWI